VPPDWPDAAPTVPGATGSTSSSPRDELATLLQENRSAGTPPWLPGGGPVRAGAVMVPKARDASVPGPKMPRAIRAASTNWRQLW
jgi:hypothetical protein